MWKSCFWHGLLVSAQNLSSEWVISSHGPGTRSEPSDKSPLMNRRRSHGGEATCHWQENNVLSGRNLAVANINHFEMTNAGNAMWHVNQYVAYEGPKTTKQCKCKRKLLCSEFTTMLEESDPLTSQVRQYNGSQDNPNVSPLRPSIEIKLCRMQQWQIICCRRMALRSLSVSIQTAQAPRHLLSTTKLLVCLS